jgi:hypothetical protein
MDSCMNLKLWEVRIIALTLHVLDLVVQSPFWYAHENLMQVIYTGCSYHIQ